MATGTHRTLKAPRSEEGSGRLLGLSYHERRRLQGALRRFDSADLTIEGIIQKGGLPNFLSQLTFERFADPRMANIDDAMIRKWMRGHPRAFRNRYDLHMQATGHYTTLWKLLEKQKDHIQGNSLFDPTVGTGEVLFYLAPYLLEMGITVTANDLSPAMLAIAKRKLRGWERKGLRITWESCDLRKWPEDQQFDTVITTYSLHDLPADERQGTQVPQAFRKSTVAKKLANAVKPGGRLIEGDEWPCEITESPFMRMSTEVLLRRSETPTRLDAFKSDLEQEEMVFYLERYRRIDPRHSLHVRVFTKPLEAESEVARDAA